nr:MAG: putative capsid protein [Arizlama virus]
MRSILAIAFCTGASLRAKICSCHWWKVVTSFEGKRRERKKNRQKKPKVKVMQRLPIKLQRKGFARASGQSKGVAYSAARQRARSAAYHANRQLPYANQQRVQAAIMGVPRGVATEVKSFDVRIASANLGLVAAVAGSEPAAAYTGLSELNCVPQGATVANRIGNKIVVKSLMVRFSLTCPNDHMAEMRAMVIYDRQPNGAFPAIGDILLNQPAGNTTYYSGLNIANKSRFLILRDQFAVCDDGGGYVKHCDWYIKGRWETEFGANAGTIGDIRTGAIYVLIYYTLATAAATVSDIQCRVRYLD